MAARLVPSDVAEAVERGDVETLRAALDAGLPVDARTVFQSTLLHIASRCGHWAAVELLLSRGADVRAIDYGGMRRTALHWACQKGHIRTVELLRDHGADTQAHGKGWFHLVQGVRCGELIDHTEPCSESPAALAKNDTIRLTLEQPPWSPALHQCFPRKFRDAARLLLMASTCATTTTTTCCGLQEGLDSRDGDVYGPALSLPAPGGAAADGGFNDGCMKGEGGEVPRNDCSFSDMPRDVVLLVVGHMAYPISAWVDPSQYRDPGDEDV